MSGSKRSLARRLFALGVLQLVLAIALATAIGVLTRPSHAPPFGPPPEALLGPPPGPAPPFTPSPGWHEMHGRDHHPPGPWGIDPGLLLPLFTLSCGIVIIGLGAFFTGRWLVQPLRRLVAAARALGNGDLSARSGLSRSDELGEVGHAFDEMAVRIRGLILSQKELLANVSHELRTPLARIRVALDLATEGDAAAAQASLLEIATDLSELERLIDDVLTTTRFELSADGHHAAYALHREEVPAAAVAEQAAKRFRQAHPSRRLEVNLEAIPCLIAVDPVLFRRVLDNLLENAGKYTPDESAPITLSLRTEPEGAIFEVQDRGVGIAAADLPHVFAPFFRGERSRDKRAGGVGLGLTLAKKIVEAHGGRIAVTSEPGAGTRVAVSLPVSAG